jgi:hypothetical protein
MSVVGRIKNGDLMIAGEYNERLPVITNGLVSHFPLDGKGGTFDVVGGEQPLQNTLPNLSLVEAMHLDWRNPANWTYASGSQNTVTWSEEKQALRIQGSHWMWLKTPLFVDTNKHYYIKAEVYQENDEYDGVTGHVCTLYLGGNGTTSTGAKYTSNYDYSITSGYDLPVGEWRTYSITRYGTANISYTGSDCGWTGENGLCQNYYFGGLFNYHGSSNSVIYIRNISIVITDAEDSNCTFTGEGVNVEEITTNLLVNPTLSNNASGWTISNYASRTPYTFINCDGYYKMHFVHNPSDTAVDTSCGISQRVNISANTIYTFTVFIDMYSSYLDSLISQYSFAPEHIDLEWFDSTVTSISVTEPTINSFIRISDNTVKVVITTTSPSNATSVRCNCFLDFPNVYMGYYLNIYKLQLEAKSFSTSFVNGSRSAQGKLMFPSLPTLPYTVNFEFTPKVPDLDTDYNFVFSDYPWNSKMGLFKRASQNFFVFRINGATGYTDYNLPTLSITQGNNYMFTLVVSSGNTDVYINGAYVLSATGDYTGQFALGGGNAYRGNNCYRNLSIYNRALTSNEISKLYNPEKFSLDSNGNISTNVTVTEKPIIPNDVFYFPLIENSKDQSGVISSNAELNTVYTQDGVWVGTSTQNYYTTYTPGGNNGGSVVDVSTSPTEAGFLYPRGAKTWKCIKNGSGNQWHGWEGVYNNWITGVAGDYFTISGYYKCVENAGLNSLGTFNLYPIDWGTKIGSQNYSEGGELKEDAEWKYYCRTAMLDSDYTGAIGADTPSWSYSTSSGLLYFHANMWEKHPFASPFCNGSRSAGKLNFNFNNSIGLDWNGNWTICYWKKPMGTSNSKMTGYNIDSLGCGGNTVGGGYIYFGKNTNSDVVYLGTGSAVAFSSYFNKFHMISFTKNGTTGTIKFWGIDGTVITRTFTYGTIASNYYVNQYGYDLMLGGWDNVNVCNAYFKDLIVAKRALTDEELQNIYNIQVKSYNKGNALNIRNNLREIIIL